MERLTRKLPGGYAMAEGYALDTLKGVRAAVNRLAAYEDTGFTPEEVQQMRWIPVEERLPKPEENPVLAFDCTGPVMAWYSPTMGWMYRTGIAGCGITHWMHLPKAPKEEKKND